MGTVDPPPGGPGRSPEAALPLSAAVFHVLLALADGPAHGYAILKEVEARTNGRVQLSTGTLYGIVKRLLEDGWIVESRAGSTDRRRAYRLTPFGRLVAQAEAARLSDLVDAAHAKKLTPKPARS
ncbi:MAG TPA: PadR family transcriptional regulator [Vicinamibacterales bacterium]|jgi:DNA-binding PadR family transcriptional regulator|nr:PadR family transcriptional regulator [Vicinamibacterales bacterium]